MVVPFARQRGRNACCGKQRDQTGQQNSFHVVSPLCSSIGAVLMALIDRNNNAPGAKQSISLY
jgi:hypothetical protein